MPTDYVTRTIATYDRIASTYADDMNDYVPEEERKKFAGYVTKGGIILDLGCAAGRDSIFFSKRGFRTVGVDLSEKLLAIARKRAPELTFLHQDIRTLQFPNESFDGIWACAILLHLKPEEMQHVIDDCHTFLKPGGTLFLMMKRGTGEADITEKLSAGEARHFTFVQEEELRKMVTAAGFTVQELYTWNSKDRYTPPRDVEWISVFAKK